MRLRQIKIFTGATEDVVKRVNAFCEGTMCSREEVEINSISAVSIEGRLAIVVDFVRYEGRHKDPPPPPGG